MKALKFAEFYHLREKNDHSYYDNAVGDRGVLILDGMENQSSHHNHANKWALKHNYDGYRLCRGTFTNPFYLTAGVIPVNRNIS